MPATSIRAVEDGLPVNWPSTWRARERNGDSSPADSNLGWTNNGHLSGAITVTLRSVIPPFNGNHCHAAIVIQAGETGETREERRLLREAFGEQRAPFNRRSLSRCDRSSKRSEEPRVGKE